jgi:hypothetical protein
MTSMLNTISNAMIADFGNAWILIVISLMAIFFILFILSQDLVVSSIFTMAPLTLMIIGTFEGVETAIPYLIIGLGAIMALILSRLFTR